MSKKIDKTNTTNRDVTWPTEPCFTIQELHALNTGFKEITLRVRVNKRREAGEIIEIGHVAGEQGRPRKIFVLAPVTQAKVDAAKNKNYSLADNIQALLATGVTPVTNIVRTASVPV